MLETLKIENYALIRSCNIDFYGGFTAITGETGAGKSIMLGALALVLGARADTQVLLDKGKKCVIEAVFSVDKKLQNVFEDNDLDYEQKSIFRREITPSGKSRAFINDTPVQLSVMKIFAQYLVDIHSQSATINLKNHDFQLSMVDSLLENHDLLSSYKDLYCQYKSINSEIDDLLQKQSELLKEKSYNEFLFEELENAKLQEDEQEEEERLLELATNAETIKENIVEALNLFDNDEDNNILGFLNETNSRISKISTHNKILAELYERLESARIELKDIYNELSSFNDELEFDENKVTQLSDRLNLIYDLQKKHNVQTIRELLQIKEQLQEKLLNADNIDGEIENKIKQKKLIINQLEDLSTQIHNQRIVSSELLCKEIKPLLDSMAMKEAVLKIEVSFQEDFNSDGKDKIRFLFNANKTKDNYLQDLSHVISGGELSRLMLAIKAVIARKYNVNTLVFDEIDTGISGDIASKAGDIMKMIAQNHQVIVITHLVQMAAKAENQYKVYKQVVDNQTQSNIGLLNEEQRIAELAKMLSGDTITKEALANAKILLEK